MKSTYIYLNKETNNKLRKLSQAKQLSLSACVDIIVKNLYYVVTYFETQNNNKIKYYDKGNIKIKLHVKSKEQLMINDNIIHNCVIFYFNQKYMSNYANQTGLKNCLKHTQHDLDTTYDRNWLKNELIRQKYRAEKGYTA